MKRFTAAILGAGNRGAFIGDLMQKHGGFIVQAVCDIDKRQLEKCKKMLHLQDEQLYDQEAVFFAEKRADVMVIATYDKDHVRQCVNAMRMGYDVLLEKPVSGSREELELLLSVQRETSRKVMVCHELRYAYGFEKLYELLQSGIIGKLIAIDAMERVAYWHQVQAYVRIQSERNDVAYPTILAKCCHDLDLVQYYAGAKCDTVTSIGELSFFRKENAPADAAEYCVNCPHMDTCPYSAKRIYIDRWKELNCPEFAWPFYRVSPKIPNTEEDLYEGIKTTCYGKCAFLCDVESNPDVVDHQIVQMQFKNGVAAVLKMVFAADAGRRINLFGSLGELILDEQNNTIEVKPFGAPKQIVELNVTDGHGGGDAHLVAHFYSALMEEGCNRTTLEESVESHLIGICAEESRHNEGKMVKVHGDDSVKEL